MARFAPQTSIITGASGGIGSALARILVRRGGHVVLTDIDRDAGTSLAAELTASGPGTASFAVLDVTDAAAITALIEKVVAQRGRLDFMANNAGILFSGPFRETTSSHWDTALSVNTRAVIDGTRAAYTAMSVAGGGTILNTASLAGLIPAPRMSPYTTSKWAVVGFTTALRAESAQDNISMHVLCPGYVDTKMLDEIAEPTSGLARGAFRHNASAMQRKLLTSEKVAEKAVRGIERGKGVIIVGLLAQALTRAQRFLPRAFEIGNMMQANKEERQAKEGKTFN